MATYLARGNAQIIRQTLAHLERREAVNLEDLLEQEEGRGGDDPPDLRVPRRPALAELVHSVDGGHHKWLCGGRSLATTRQPAPACSQAVGFALNLAMACGHAFAIGFEGHSYVLPKPGRW